MDWGNTKSALMTSGGGSTGVREYIKGRIGLYGNTGEPNVSARNAGNVDGREKKKSDFVMDNIAFITREKKRAISQAVTEPRETEGKVKDEGSLSIPIVPTESWEIQPGKASE